EQNAPISMNRGIAAHVGRATELYAACPRKDTAASKLRMSNDATNPDRMKEKPMFTPIAMNINSKQMQRIPAVTGSICPSSQYSHTKHAKKLSFRFMPVDFTFPPGCFSWEASPATCQETAMSR